jgi:hypothetical protein
MFLPLSNLGEGRSVDRGLGGEVSSRWGVRFLPLDRRYLWRLLCRLEDGGPISSRALRLAPSPFGRGSGSVGAGGEGTARRGYLIAYFSVIVSVCPVASVIGASNDTATPSPCGVTVAATGAPPSSACAACAPEKLPSRSVLSVRLP